MTANSASRLPARTFWAVVAVALALRLIWIALVDPQVGLVDDAGYYDFFAVSIKDGQGYVLPDGSPTAFWPVGYPGALAALYTVFGHSLVAAKLLNALLGAATAGLVYLLARRWFGAWQATAAGMIYAAFPGAIGFASLTMSETLFTFLFVAALYVVARAVETDSHDILWAAAFAVIAAATAYVRGQALALPFFAAAWLLLAGWGWQRVLAYSGVALALMIGLSIPWLVRNTIVFGEPTFLSTNFGINLWLGHNPAADGGFDYQQQLGFAGQFADLPAVERELAWNREGLRQGVRYLLNHPIDEAGLSVKKIINLYRDDSDAIRWNEQNGGGLIFGSSERVALRATFDSYFYVALTAGAAGLCIGLWRRQPWLGPVACTVALWTLVHVVFFAEPRLHAPILPFLAIAATVPLVELLRFAQSGSRAKPIAAAGAESPASRV